MRLRTSVLFCFALCVHLILVYGQKEVTDGSSLQDQYNNEITAVIVTAVLCGLGLIICCTGLVICCYVKCCTGDGCII